MRRIAWTSLPDGAPMPHSCGQRGTAAEAVNQCEQASRETHARAMLHFFAANKGFFASQSNLSSQWCCRSRWESAGPEMDTGSMDHSFSPLCLVSDIFYQKFLSPRDIKLIGACIRQTNRDGSPCCIISHSAVQ